MTTVSETTREKFAGCRLGALGSTDKWQELASEKIAEMKNRWPARVNFIEDTSRMI
jgi:hypothetical protein